ncbi:hypothetical protein R6Q59_009912 [Mikania micrantha]
MHGDTRHYNMSTLFQTPTRSPFDLSPTAKSRSRPMAIVSQSGNSPKSSQGDRSQVTSPSTSMGPPRTTSPEAEQHDLDRSGAKDQNGQANAASAGGSSSSKVVQTAFIHKLYSMLEDRSIQHLISWSNTNDSFVMSPSNDFSKVLAQYFKHTNISSFVRQLNMYGFHKVSDVFHTGSPESALWEFRHGNGNFRKGDLMGLREIKRRASRHTLIHRDSFPNPKPGVSQPGTPQEIIPDTESRVAHLEYLLHDIHSRLSRSEDNYAVMSSRCQTLTDGLVRCHHWVQGLSGTIQSLGSSDASIRAEISNIQQDVARQLDQLRMLEQLPDSLSNGSSRQTQYPSHMALDPPLSPRGYGFSESRRSSIQLQDASPFGRPPMPPVPPQFSSPRRYGSISAPQGSPGFSRLPPPPQPHPLSNVVSQPAPNLARRHTSADIREHWPVPGVSHNNGSPYESGDSSVQWQPSSPQQIPQQGDQQIREQLATYEISGRRRSTIVANNQDSVPPHSDPPPPSGLGVENLSWSVGAPKFPRPNFDLHSAPATRRSSTVSNVHSLLNSADTAERPSEDESMNDDRKRKRLE